MFLIDENSKKRFVQIDLKKHGELWEDFYDSFMAQMAKDEESISIEDLGNELKEEGLINEI